MTLEVCHHKTTRQEGHRCCRTHTLPGTPSTRNLSVRGSNTGSQVASRCTELGPQQQQQLAPGWSRVRSAIAHGWLLCTSARQQVWGQLARPLYSNHRISERAVTQ